MPSPPREQISGKMSLFRRMRHIFHEDWCSECLTEMEIVRKQLYAMPDHTGPITSEDLELDSGWGIIPPTRTRNITKRIWSPYGKRRRSPPGHTPVG